ncbi:hypothetical protein [Paenibacillus popilliae]|uniref:Outer membrane protein n=1 Tax=Paenibacillus popilliae ATCC 14706 TaxID=1212764 RepID=M9LDK4_PAEPP|nr:hypothetical protein [Paenibacillus popilliae]GAC44482.1 outer membrane protein [Paenibacillus popilliae ATCC 14706]
MSSKHLENWHRVKRDLSIEEKRWIHKLLSVNFDGRDILKNQMEYAKVIGSCLCGCRTIDIEIESKSHCFHNQTRVPVEMIIDNGNSAPTIFYLHVVEGYITELEVFKADSSEIKGLISLDNALIRVNSD